MCLMFFAVCEFFEQFIIWTYWMNMIQSGTEWVILFVNEPN